MNIDVEIVKIILVHDLLWVNSIIASHYIIITHPRKSNVQDIFVNSF